MPETDDLRESVGRAAHEAFWKWAIGKGYADHIFDPMFKDTGRSRASGDTIGRITITTWEKLTDGAQHQYALTGMAGYEIGTHWGAHSQVLHADRRATKAEQERDKATSLAEEWRKECLRACAKRDALAADARSERDAYRLAIQAIESMTQEERGLSLTAEEARLVLSCVIYNARVADDYRTQNWTDFERWDLDRAALEAKLRVALARLATEEGGC